MKYVDLRDFVRQLERAGELRRVQVPVSPKLEVTEICDRVLRAGGPALVFEQPIGHSIPVLANLFGTPRRVAWGRGAEDVTALVQRLEALAGGALPAGPAAASAPRPVARSSNARPKTESW